MYTVTQFCLSLEMLYPLGTVRPLAYIWTLEIYSHNRYTMVVAFIWLIRKWRKINQTGTMKGTPGNWSLKMWIFPSSRIIQVCVCTWVRACSPGFSCCAWLHSCLLHKVILLQRDSTSTKVRVYIIMKNPWCITFWGATISMANVLIAFQAITSPRGSIATAYRQRETERDRELLAKRGILFLFT